MCTLCFIFCLVVYIIGSAKITVNRQYKEWLDEQHEVRKHVTDNVHHEHERNFGGM